MTIELNLDYILRVRPVVQLVLHHAGLCDLDHERDLEEYGAVPGAVLCALLDVVNEDLGREKCVAELALHCQSMLDHTLIYLD